MTVSVRPDGVIELSGRCGVEDAEALQRYLLAAPKSAMGWSDCEQLHTAVLQVLLAAEARIEGTPSSPFLATHIARLLRPPAPKNSLQALRQEGNS